MKDKILDILRGGQADFSYIHNSLNHRSKFRTNEALKELIEEDKIIYDFRSRFYLIDNSTTKEGFYRETKNDYGFVEVDSSEDSIFIPGRFTQNALEGDLVKVKIVLPDAKSINGKSFGKVVRILERNAKNILGQAVYINETDETLFIPETPRNKNKKFLLNILTNEVNHGDIIVARFSKIHNKTVYLDIIDNLGSQLENPKIDKQIVLKKNNLEFPKIDNDLIKSIGNQFANDKLDGRVLFHNDLIYTIDDITSKDLDDAIQFKKLPNGGYKLFIHIADVSHYVEKGSKLDIEAFKKATSIYMINDVIPMLPKILSNDICSLNENEKKFTVTCELDLSSELDTIKTKVYKSQIISKHRLTYDEVNDLIDGKVKLIHGSKELSQNLIDANNFSLLLQNKMRKENSIYLTVPEPHFILDENDDVIDITNKVQRSSEKLIECFMVMANRSVAKLFVDKDIPTMFRVHREPKSENIDEFLNIFTANLGIKKSSVSFSNTNWIIDTINKSQDRDMLTRFFLSVMEKAIYAPKNLSHYGLGAKEYLHFTSPIRRYPDLIVHRMLDKYIIKNSNFEYKKLFKQVNEYAEHCTSQEKNATAIERNLWKIKQARFLNNKYDILDENKMEGKIVSIKKFGVFVELEKGINGFIDLSLWDKEDVIYDEINKKISNSILGISFSLGINIKVIIEKISLINGNIFLKAI